MRQKYDKYCHGTGKKRIVSTLLTRRPAILLMCISSVQIFQSFTFAVMDYPALDGYINQVVDLSPEDLTLLHTCIEERHLKKGEVLLREGEVCRQIYLVHHGYLRSCYNKEGVPINLNFTFEGEFVSNFKSYRGKLPSEYTIEAGEPSDVWILTLSKITGSINDYPQIGRFFRRVAIALLLKAEEHIDLFKIYTPAERYHYIQKHNERLLQRISLSQLASYLGVSRETLSRIRAKH
jgi:CRP-like cAMP-binding protein